MNAGSPELPLSTGPVGIPQARIGKRRRLSRLARLRDSAQSHSAAALTLILSVVVAGSLLAVGTVHVATLLFVAPVAILAGVVAIWVESNRERRLPLAGVVMFALSTYSLLQSLPVPPSWLRVLSPNAAQTWQDAFRLTGTAQSTWASVSVDPGASRVEALKWMSYAMVFVSAARLAREKGSQRGAAIVIGSAVLGGILSLAHGLFGVDDWLGLYHPQLAHSPWATAPLLNPNNFAGYLNLALFVGIGLLFVRKPIAPRWLIALAIIVLAALVILTASRGGVLSLIVGFGISGFAYWAQQVHARKRGGFLFPPWIPLATVGLAATALAVIGSTDVIWQQLLDETAGKLRIAEYSLPVIRDHFWTGVGRGAFETAFAAYRRESGHHITQYAENFVVQWIVEWGLPVSVVAVSILAWNLRPKRVGIGQNALPTGIFVAVTALLLQNLVDLATEVTSVGIATAMLLGTLHGGADYFKDVRAQVRAARRKIDAPQSKSKVAIRTGQPTAIALSFVVVGIGLSAFVTRTAQPDAIDQRSQLAAELVGLVGKQSGDPGYSNLQRHLTDALLRHPADPYIPVVGAVLARESGQGVLAWIGQAIRRDPMNARPHLLLADALAAHGAMNQAFFELRRTVELGPDLVGEAANRISRWTKTTDEILRAVPDGVSGVPLLNTLAQHFVTTPEARRIRQYLFAQALMRRPRDVDTNATMAGDLMASLSSDSGPCSGEYRADCELRLRKHGDVVVKDAAHLQAGIVMQGKLLAFDNKFDEAERWLAEQCPKVADPRSCMADRVLYAMKLNDGGRFEEAASAYTSAACSTSLACADAYAWTASLELQRRNLAGALARYERAAQEQPSPEAWLRVTEVAMQLGRIARADAALTNARRLGRAETMPLVEARLKELQKEQLIHDLATPEAGHRH